MAPMQPDEDFIIRLAGADDYQAVGSLVCRLLHELFPDHYSPRNLDALTEAARSLLRDENGFWVVLAFRKTPEGDGEPVALMSLDEGRALYAYGVMGEIMEFYVSPECRSTGLGARLIAFARAFGQERRWSGLEVGAPDVPRWQRTVDFYLRNGFSEVGPRLEMSL